jgi:hypothetical protein
MTRKPNQIIMTKILPFILLVVFHIDSVGQQKAGFFLEAVASKTADIPGSIKVNRSCTGKFLFTKLENMMVHMRTP